MRLFRRQRASSPDPVLIPTQYPYGMAVQTEEGVYFLKEKTKFKLYSQRCADSWRFPILPGSKESVSKYIYGGYMGFRDGSLIKNIANGKIYLVSQQKRRHITSPDVFGRYGFDRNLIIEVSETETNLHEEGEPLS